MAQMRFFSAIFVLTLLLVSTGDMMGAKVAEARICEALSHKFRGLCVIARNCANVCQTEGFHGGTCRGFRRRCFCIKPC